MEFFFNELVLLRHNLNQRGADYLNLFYVLVKCKTRGNKYVYIFDGVF
jgi:hypothetical protein